MASVEGSCSRGVISAGLDAGSSRQTYHILQGPAEVGRDGLLEGGVIVAKEIPAERWEHVSSSS